MAFESLGDKLQNVFKKLRGKGRVSEKDIKDAMREVRLALLEADVNFKVARDFIKVVSEKAVGTDVLESLTPAQQIIKIVRRRGLKDNRNKNTSVCIDNKQREEFFSDCKKSHHYQDTKLYEIMYMEEDKDLYIKWDKLIADMYQQGLEETSSKN